MKTLLDQNIVHLVQSIKKYYNLNNEHKTNEQLDELLKNTKPKTYSIYVFRWIRI